MTALKRVIETELVRKAAQYFIVGGISALIDWVFFALFFYVVDAHYLIAGTLSFIFATAFNFVLSVRYVFDSDLPSPLS